MNPKKAENIGIKIQKKRNAKFHQVRIHYKYGWVYIE